MKQLLILVVLFSAMIAQAQEKYAPKIKQGSRLTYVASVQGQEIPLEISYDSIGTDYLKMGWSIEGLGNGTWITKKNSIDNATRGWWDEPAAGVETELADDQTVLLLSRAQWKGLQNDKKIEYDMQTFTPVQANEQQLLKLDGKVVDALLLQGQNGSTRLWVLNDATLPVILKIEGNTLGPDLDLRSIQ